MSLDPNADRARGIAVGSSAGLLTVAAHGAAGGGLPDATSSTVLVAVCAVIGALATTTVTRSRFATAALLGAGQLAGHAALSTTMHHVHSAGPGTLPMLTAHAIATVLCAVLIVAAARLLSAITHVVRVIAILDYRLDTPIRQRPIARSTAPQFTVPFTDVISRRGPPLPSF